MPWNCLCSSKSKNRRPQISAPILNVSPFLCFKNTKKKNQHFILFHSVYLNLNWRKKKLDRFFAFVIITLIWIQSNLETFLGWTFRKQPHRVAHLFWMKTIERTANVNDLKFCLGLKYIVARIMRLYAMVSCCQNIQQRVNAPMNLPKWLFSATISNWHRVIWSEYIECRESLNEICNAC